MKYFFILAITAGVLASCTGTDASGSKSKNDSVKHAQFMNAVSDTANYTSLQWIDST